MLPACGHKQRQIACGVTQWRDHDELRRWGQGRRYSLQPLRVDDPFGGEVRIDEVRQLVDPLRAVGVPGLARGLPALLVKVVLA